jgi:arabinose-5-phosphate isomerase
VTVARSTDTQSTETQPTGAQPTETQPTETQPTDTRQTAAAATERDLRETTSRWREIATAVLEIEAAAITGLLDQLDASFDRAVELIRDCRGRVVCTGMGKSGHVMKKVSATLASTGTPSFFLHPAEAIHGDLGMIVEGDVLLAASYSGTTEELLRMAPTLERKGVPLIAITSNAASTLAEVATVHLPAMIDKEACPLNLAPTASTTATLALGDALAMALLEARGFTAEDFATLHPGGQLGRRLLRVAQLAQRGDAIPAVTANTPLRDAIYEMSRKGLGVTAVVDEEQRLIGVFSDGDLRRLLEQEQTSADLLGRPMERCMKPRPKTIDADAFAIDALERMEDHRITSLFLCDEAGRLSGIVHIHDLWSLQLASARSSGSRITPPGASPQHGERSK